MRSQLGSRSVAWLAGAVSALCALALVAALVGADRAAAQGVGGQTCLYPGADAFTGDSLDLANRWKSTLRHDPQLYDIADGKAKVQTGPYEIQTNDQGQAAPNIFLQPAPEGTWEITTKVKIAQTHEGQQAGLLLSDPTGNDIVKLTYVKKQDGVNGNKWIEFLKIVDGQYDFSGTWHSPETPNYPDELWLRYRSDGNTLSGWYSVDGGQTWLSAGDSRNYDAIENPQVGFYALRGDPADPAVTAEFESFNLVPANDEFEGTALDECRWTEIFNRNDAGMSVGNGELTLRTLQGELSGDESGVQNMILQKTNDSDWQATTKLTMSPNTAGQQGGLVIWGNNTDPTKANYVKLVFVRKNGGTTNNGWIEFLKTTDGVTEFGADADWNSGLGNYGPTVYLRLTSANDQLLAHWSPDGTTWNKVGKTHPITGIANPQVGLMALKGTDAAKPEVDAKFDWFRISPAEVEPPVQQSIFNTIGITMLDTRANSQINGNPSPYSFIGEQMPPSRSVGVPGDDSTDDVPLRMPDTRGNVPNLASFSGQKYTLTESQQKAYSKIHFFGTATDAGGTPSGGEFTLTFAGGATEKVLVRFRDWANTNHTADDHVAIRTNPRYTTTGTQGNIDFYIFHKPMNVSEANRGKVLESITLPPNSTPGGAATRAYLMALTLEQADGAFEMPILGANSQFPNDNEPPVSSATVDPPAPDGDNGWYKRHVEVTLDAEDEAGGSDVDAIEYRLGSGAWLQYDGQPVLVDLDGNHSFQYRAMDRAGNLETQKVLNLKMDATAPEVEAEVQPNLPEGGDWYDRSATLTLDGFDGNGSGIATAEYSVDGGPWQAYTGPVEFDDDGTYEVAYRARDRAGNVSAETEPVLVQIDTAAPTTALLINGAAPVGTYGQPATVTLDAADGEGSGVAYTEYRLDDGEWTEYTGPITVAALGLHRIEFGSIDEAGNMEATRQVAFTRADPPTGGSGNPTPPPPPGPAGDEPAPKPEPWASLGSVRRALSTVGAFRAGKLSVPVTCQSVERGTLRLTVSRKLAKRLGLKSTTLASASVTCEGAGTTVTLKPSKSVKRKLARKARTITAKLTLRLTGADGTASDSTTLTLRR